MLRLSALPAIIAPVLAAIAATYGFAPGQIEAALASLLRGLRGL